MTLGALIAPGTVRAETRFAHAFSYGRTPKGIKNDRKEVLSGILPGRFLVQFRFFWSVIRYSISDFCVAPSGVATLASRELDHRGTFASMHVPVRVLVHGRLNPSVVYMVSALP